MGQGSVLESEAVVVRRIRAGVLALGLLLPAIVSITSCSGTSGGFGDDGGTVDSAGGSGGNSSGGRESGAGSGSGGGGSSGSSSGSPPPISDDASIDSICPMMTRAGQCAACCQQNHVGGVNTYYTALGRCACGASGACQSECATTYCATSKQMPASGSTCGTCLNAALGSGGACVAPVNTACQADPDCVAFRMGCLPSCP